MRLTTINRVEMISVMIRKSHEIPVVGKGDHYMTTTMVANALRISPQAVHKAIKEDRLEATEFVGRYFILKSDAKKFASATGRRFQDD